MSAINLSLADLLVDHPGRFDMKRIGCMVSGGIHCGAMYLYDGEGPKEANLDILQLVGGILNLITGPWIVGLDGNMTP